jgi:WD repeat-containing protein 61
MSIQVVKIRDFVGHRQSIYCMAINPLTKEIYSAAGDGMIVKWQIDEQDGLLIARDEFPIYSLCCFQNFIISGNSIGELMIIDLLNSHQPRKIKLIDAPIFDIQVIDKNIYITTGNGQLFVLALDFEILTKIKVSNKSIRKIIQTKDGLAIAGSEPGIWLYDKNWQLLKVIHDFNSSVFALAFHQQSHTLISGGRDAVLNFHEPKLAIFDTVKAHLLHVNDIQFNAAQNFFLSASMDKTIKLWDYENKTLLKVIDKEKYSAHTSSVNKILWFDENTFISCSDDRTLKCFEIKEK